MRVLSKVRALWARPASAVRIAKRSNRPIKYLDQVLQALEAREVPAGLRAIDEVGNNVAHPTWGSTNADFIRVSAPDYADGIGAVASTRPSARVISNTIVDHPDADIKNDRGMSNFVYAWGQFIDHDLDLTNTAAAAGTLPITVPTGDAEFDPTGTGTATMSFTRSVVAAGSGVTTPRMQTNAITSFLDGSMVYGSDTATALSLRTMTDGKLKTSSGNLLPTDSTGFFSAGDVRANENPELTSVQTLFVREHNRIATQLKSQNPTWNDEKLYQEARRRVIAEIEAITYNEFLPALLGSNNLQPYKGYNPRVNATVSTEFSTAAFRFGHSMLGNDIEFLDNNGNEIAEPLALKDAFFNPAVVTANGIDPMLKYLASDQAEEIDVKVVDGLRNFLFGLPGQGGLDLASLNIQRGRDHGVDDYNAVRQAYGLPRVTSFSQITKNPVTQQQLQVLYGSVDNIDLWVGGLAEDHLPGGSLGPTFTRIVADQFERTRAGDRFWYENDFSGKELQNLRGTKLSDIIKRNTSLTNLQDNVFFFKTSIGGQVFNDANHDGRMNPGEGGRGGVTVQLRDSTGAVVATTITGIDGRYAFTSVGLGTFTVTLMAPSGSITTPPPAPVTITRGMDVNNVNFGLFSISSPPPPGPGMPPPPHGPGMPPPPRLTVKSTR
ncbi:peroxidase family protein [soil metagenome]